MITENIKKSLLEHLLQEADVLNLIDKKETIDDKIEYLLGKGKKNELWKICQNYNDPDLVNKIKSIIDPS